MNCGIDVEACRLHVLSQIEAAVVCMKPFFHVFIDNLFPIEAYQMIRNHMLECKNSGQLQSRHQDNPNFLNLRYNLSGDEGEVPRMIRSIFSDSDVIFACLKKFYIYPTRELFELLLIHQEFEYFFTKAGRFQNIHIDIPPKYLSFVFYIPEKVLPLEEERSNATILYGSDLAPHYSARFAENSVCMFAPHFSSYHGFSSTQDRDVLVMFYVNPGDLAAWQQMRQEGKDCEPFAEIREFIARKIKSYPLIEIGDDPTSQQIARASCLVNAPQGRVLKHE